MQALKHALPTSHIGSTAQQRLISKPAVPSDTSTSRRRRLSAPRVQRAATQRRTITPQALGLGSFVQGLAAKLTGARNADDATPAGAYALLEDERAVLLDIRPKGEAGKAGSPDLREFRGKRIITLPFDYEAPEQFVAKFMRLSAVDGDSLVLLLDSDGTEAPAAAAALAADKDTPGQKFYPIRGGAVAWQENDLPWRSGGLSLSLPGLSLPSLPTDLDQLAEDFKANPTVGSAALSLLAIVGSATFIINEFDVILELAGVLGVSAFSIKNLLYADDRERLLRRIQAFLKDEVGAESASEELRKLAERALATTEAKTSASNGTGAEVRDWINGWQAKQQEVTQGVQKAVAAAAASARKGANEAKQAAQVRSQQAASAPAPPAAAPAAPMTSAASAPAAVTESAGPAVKPSPTVKRLQSVQEAREWIAEWQASKQQAKEAGAAQAPAAATAAAPEVQQQAPSQAAQVPTAKEATDMASAAVAAPPAEEAAAAVENAAAPAEVVPAAAEVKAAEVVPATAEVKAAPAQAAANVQEAREWIAQWRSRQQAQEAQQTQEAQHVEAKLQDVPVNVQEARDWISNWRTKQLHKVVEAVAAVSTEVKQDHNGQAEEDADKEQLNGQAKQETVKERVLETVNA